MSVTMGGLARRDPIAAWVAIVLLGSVVRLMQAIPSDFPLGDGGLFYAAIEAMRADGGLPQTIPYNEGIPFVYPPLGFAAAAGVASLPGLDTMTVLQFLPALLAIGVVAIVPWTASRFLGSVGAGLLAGAMVALMPQTYDQLVAGGGVTRALGVLLAMVAIGVAAGPTPGRRRGIVTGLFLGLTALAHPQVAIFAFVSVAFTWWVQRERVAPGEAVLAIAAGAVVILPWLATIVARGQLDSLLAGGQRFDLAAGLVGLVAYPAMQAMHGGVPNIAVAIAIAGVATSLLLRRWKIPLWLLVVHALGAPVFISPIAWAFAGADGLAAAVSMIRQHKDSRPGRAPALRASRSSPWWPSSAPRRARPIRDRSNSRCCPHRSTLHSRSGTCPMMRASRSSPRKRGETTSSASGFPPCPAAPSSRPHRARSGLVWTSSPSAGTRTTLHEDATGRRPSAWRSSSRPVSSQQPTS